MLHLIQSNKMEVLASHLVNYLKAKGQLKDKAHDEYFSMDNIFEAEQILVQSPGMSQWLKIQIAEATGIAANIEFPLPSSFIWQLYRQHIQNLPEQSSFTKPNMAWKIMAVLPGLLEQPSFEPIKIYLVDNPEFKVYQLAQKIADVYDQYLVYRPEWILSWEEGVDKLEDIANVSEPEAHLWQPILWRAMRDYSQSLGESVYHRANLHQAILTELHNTPTKTQKPLMVFGISAMPTQQLEVLNALSTQRDVIIFWFNPSQHYWGDIVDNKTHAKVQLKQQEKAEVLDVGNPLLASWGKLGRDYQDMLLGVDIQQQDLFVDTEAQTLLQYIQEEVNHLAYRGASEPLSAEELLSNGVEYPKTPLSEQDRSIQIHLCHSKVRELQVLHDQLLRLFQKNPDCSPGDVIVMMPDVTVYAPFIEGVFGAVDSHRHIPFAISDQNYAQVSPLINSFLAVMKLHQSRGTLSDILSLLEIPAIQQKFDISLQEFELIQHWLSDAGVRWGWDGEDKIRWDLPKEQQNTWLFGLHRLLVGYAMSGEALFVNNGVNELSTIAPYADIEGQQSVALGKCYMVIQVLLSSLEFCLTSDTLANKVEYALGLLERLYDVPEQEQAEFTTLRETIENLNHHASQYPHAISQDVFVAELEQNIQQKGVGQRFLAGYVNFCTLMPMRSIPFKHVCLLGMNDADYPRQSIPMGFDLMRLAPVKRGDRSRRLDDRYLFLEAILSAREALYISYQGFSQRDNKPLSPSILVNELIEYCQQGYALKSDLDSTNQVSVEHTETNLIQHLQIEHRLQAFDPSYFDGEQNDRQSFNQQALAIANKLNQPLEHRPFINTDIANHSKERIEDTSKLTSQLELGSLIRFFQNPAQAYFEYKWQTRFYSLAEGKSDVEPFVFDGLDKFKINQQLVNAQLAAYQQTDENKVSVNNSQLVAQLRAQGILPIGLSGELSLKPLIQSSKRISQQIIELTQGTSESLIGQGLAAKNQQIELVVNGIDIFTRLEQVYGDNLVFWRTGKVRVKDKIECYLTWLVFCASHASISKGKVYYINQDKPYSLPALEPELAKQQLALWLDYYRLGHQQALHFYPMASYKWAQKQDINQALQAFIGSDFSAGDISDPHIQRLCPDLTVQFEEFSQVSQTLLQGLIDLEGQK